MDKMLKLTAHLFTIKYPWIVIDGTGHASMITRPNHRVKGWRKSYTKKTMIVVDTQKTGLY